MTNKELLELALRMRERLVFNPVTGIFRWYKIHGLRVELGNIAGQRVNSHGYKHIQFEKKLYPAHRLAWFFVHGDWPNQIDHINGNRADNRIENLRNVTVEINNQNRRTAHKNSKTGVLGVIKKPSGKFFAEIRVKGKKIHLGSFDDCQQASEAYLKAKRELHERATI